MRIGVSVSGTGIGCTGIGRLTVSLLPQLVAIAPRDEFVVFHWRMGRQARPSFVPDLPNVTYQSFWIPGRIQLLLERAAWFRANFLVGHLDALLEMNFIPPPIDADALVLYVYDIAFLQRPELYTGLATERWVVNAQKAIVSADRIAALSESTARDITERLGVPSHRIDVIAPGCDAAFRPLRESRVRDYRRRRGLPERFVLCLGAVVRRKNYPALIRAFAQSKGLEGYGLVLAGPGGPDLPLVLKEVERCQLSARFRDLGYVSDAELHLLLNASSIVAVPSLYEGFGLPVLEAMRCGIPVVASRVPGLVDACGRDATYFDPHDEASIRRALDRLASRRVQLRYRQRGLRRAAPYSWRRTAEGLMNSIRKSVAV